MPLWKRTIDIAVSVAVLPILGICVLLMMLMQALCSPGPIFYMQERVGLKGRRFQIYKFRTMHIGADTAAHRAHYSSLMVSNEPMVKLDCKGDKRLIPGGWLLRALGADELPQILNVLEGDMSIVGPRPCIPYEYEGYTTWQRRRFDSTPGLTGLWQVSGKNRTTFDEMIRLDHEYHDKLSFWLDAKIILKTLPAILLQVHDARKVREKKARSRRTNEFRQPEPAKGIQVIE
jgi:lipopolysaccharide/colanic/teichoic acid biosynthesis glycosyltransferase